MRLEIDGRELYSSKFDSKTGCIIREVEVVKNRWGDVDNGFRERFTNRYDSYCSPSPETVDIAITNKCGFGCEYCYQDSLPANKHGKKELVKQILTGFENIPYQIAIGGGEPVLHPDFIEILKEASKIGTVPNYTTAGGHLPDNILKATNEYCGGVAITYHSFKGIEWFLKRYSKLHEGVNCQVNIHLIADKDVVKNLDDLTERIGAFNLVLLAYYPDIGRASLNNLITRTAYTKHLPAAIKRASSAGVKIAFSEGLIPYFISRPEIGIETRFATRTEGRFSCYVDSDGRMSHSSFSPAYEENATVWEKSSQELWERLYSGNNYPHGSSCYNCSKSSRCSVPEDFHYFLCAYAEHNKLPLSKENA